MLLCGDLELSNNLENVFLYSPVIELKACEFCGQWGDGSAYAQCRRIGTDVAWFDHHPTDAEWSPSGHSEVITAKGAILFRNATWRYIQGKFLDVPDQEFHPLARRIDFANEWVAECLRIDNARLIPQKSSHLEQLRWFNDLNRNRYVLACVGLSEVEYSQQVHRLVDWVEEDPEAEVDASFVSTQGEPVRCYLDAAGYPEWTPFVKSRFGFGLVLGEGLAVALP
jgi:hypothetical protein